MDQQRAVKELEAMLDTLNTKGWDLLAEGFAAQFEGCNQVIGCTTERDLYVRQGQLMILQQLCTLKADVRDELAEAENRGMESADL